MVMEEDLVVEKQITLVHNGMVINSKSTMLKRMEALEHQWQGPPLRRHLREGQQLLRRRKTRRPISSTLARRRPQRPRMARRRLPPTYWMTSGRVKKMTLMISSRLARLPWVSPPQHLWLLHYTPPPMTSTTTSSTQFAAPQPVAPPQQGNLNSLFATTSQPSSATPSMKSPPPSSLGSPPPPLQAQPYKPSGPNYYTSVPAAMNTGSSATSAFSARPSVASTNQTSYSSSTSAATLGKPTAKASAGSGDVFGNLWSSASSKAGVPNKPTSKGPDLASMAKAKSEAGIWGAPAAVSGLSQPRPGATAPTPNTAAQGKPLTQQQSLGNGLDDLLG